MSNLVTNKVKLRIKNYNSILFISCANMLLNNGFIQTGDYVFTRFNKETQDKRVFCLYGLYPKELVLSIYYPQERMKRIVSVEQMQQQIDRFNC